MIKFIVNFLGQMIDQLPISMRQPRHYNWLWALLKPFRWLYDQFVVFRGIIRDEISRNGQEISLEKILNDRYDPTLKRIYIDDYQATTPVAIWLISELQPITALWLISEIPPGTALELKTIEEHGSLGIFIVYIPIGLVFDLVILSGLINRYKLAGLQWKIEYF